MSILDPSFVNLKLNAATVQEAEDKKQDVIDIIKDENFWEATELFVKIFFPVVKCLRLADSNQPAMDKIYYFTKMTTRRLNDDTNKLNDLKNKRKDKKQEVREAIAQQDIQKSVTSSNESEINKLGKNTTKEQWDAGKADEAIEELYDRLDGLVKSKIPRNQPPGFSAEDFVSETIFELIPHIRNFNPEVNDSLSGWINSQLSNKIGNVFRKGTAGTKDVFETDITEARKVAAEETALPEVTEKPKARKINPIDLARDENMWKSRYCFTGKTYL